MSHSGGSHPWQCVYSNWDKNLSEKRLQTWSKRMGVFTKNCILCIAHKLGYKVKIKDWRSVIIVCSFIRLIRNLILVQKLNSETAKKSNCYSFIKQHWCGQSRNPLARVFLSVYSVPAGSPFFWNNRQQLHNRDNNLNHPIHEQSHLIGQSCVHNIVSFSVN